MSFKADRLCTAIFPTCEIREGAVNVCTDFIGSYFKYEPPCSLWQTLVGFYQLKYNTCTTVLHVGHKVGAILSFILFIFFIFTEPLRYKGRGLIGHRCCLLKAGPLLTPNQASCCVHVMFGLP